MDNQTLNIHHCRVSDSGLLGMDEARQLARSHNLYYRQMMEIHSIQDQDHNDYWIVKYSLLQIYLSCAQLVKDYHRSGQISQST
jgi:hypothetical protein